ncbi:PREDICTED: late embryogenesis abundant protein 3-like [Tarenaya hassleriana]|uniref:late embryogenesis abundant protein 3-like n=1 Tax=Tarenaya hassleriana TaxID=28532 RepID=UPI00053CA188|nr:PREDICTED: late embryogenesis abundant protein 3-like [Tarenaya hassleriana]
MAQKQQPEMPRDPIKCHDVFNVSDPEIADDPPVTAGDAATVQTTDVQKTLTGSSASTMPSSPANFNNRATTESIREQAMGKFVDPAEEEEDPEGTAGGDTVTIGEALEAAAISIGDKPVDRKDAAAIHTAETIVTGGKTVPGGVAAAAEAAAAMNEMNVESKVTIADVLTDAMDKLPRDKEVTGEDAEAVVGAELRNSPEMKTTPGGVADSMSAGARLNRQVS